MSGPSDKARFHMEQAVPQLQEFKEKKIFTDVGTLQSAQGFSNRSSNADTGRNQDTCEEKIRL